MRFDADEMMMIQKGNDTLSLQVSEQRKYSMQPTPKMRKRMQRQFDEKQHKLYRNIKEIVRDSYSDMSAVSASKEHKDNEFMARKEKKKREFDKFMVGITHDLNLKLGTKLH